MVDLYSEDGGSWLLGDFCAVDIMFAPVVSRFQTYDVPVTGSAREYYRRILDHPLFVEWLEQGKAENSFIEHFELPQAGSSPTGSVPLEYSLRIA